MSEILLHNTMSNRKEPLDPLHPGEVRIYSCGPTVYDYAHIGNFRTFVFQDILRRFLGARGYRLNHVMNMTDVDDRIIQNAAAAGVGIREYTDKYAKAFLEDTQVLSLESPEKIVRATDNIEDMVALIERLQKKTFTYDSEGSIYYRIAKFPEYGKLSKIDLGGMQAGARVDVDRYEKADVRDFALWKARKPGEHFWNTNIGEGRPGWHIECSAMAMKYLGETIDIHTGGVDLAFPHHENEIAQSEAATGKQFVKLWLHSEHLLVEGEKMSKSLGNFFTLRDLLGKGHKPSSIRFLLLSVPYRSQLNFTMEGLQQAARSVERLRNFVARVRAGGFPDGESRPVTERVKAAEAAFDEGLADDLNTAQALAAIFDLVRDVNTAIDREEFQKDNAAVVLAAFQKFNRILAVLDDNDEEKLRLVGLAGGPPALSDAEVEVLVQQRQEARRMRNFKRGDEIRQQLADNGIILEDNKQGNVTWKRK
jgi:cysteinyl-tRNA synthetase